MLKTEKKKDKNDWRKINHSEEGELTPNSIRCIR